MDPKDARLLKQLFPGKSAEDALQALLQAELERRGGKDPVSGAFTRISLTQGALLEKEYDHSLHGHTGWQVQALLIDITRLIRVNVRYGFSCGDAVLNDVADTLAALHPKAKVVRIHS